MPARNEANPSNTSRDIKFNCGPSPSLSSGKMNACPKRIASEIGENQDQWQVTVSISSPAACRWTEVKYWLSGERSTSAVMFRSWRAAAALYTLNDFTQLAAPTRRHRHLADSTPSRSLFQRLKPKEKASHCTSLTFRETLQRDLHQTPSNINGTPQCSI